ncbi:TonB-dependent receptor [Echinicola jeungdonensis]|uniref:TonB-dependent receptor n=1 Tax=Echinicola jeungdonensis TaxID=709343 RepID=A0ABV5J8A9_9BACT|nr:TonB-dependent receptor [Echinicola jeungdonensis]MDN3669494.1 TonB-dependent receptor [Echinicola jeungdonensis]
MKLTLILVLVGVMKVSASAYSQNVKLALDLRQATVEQVFEEIKSQSEFNFLYRTDLVKDLPKVDVNLKKVRIEKVLDQILGPHQLTYEIQDKTIIISKKETKTQNETQLLDEVNANEVTGTVTDENGQPIPGATIQVQGTTRGTVTDLDGKYSIDVEEGATLIFSFIGYKKQPREVRKQTIMDVSLSPDLGNLEEVVVIGYGAVKKEDLTGSVASISSETIQKTTVPDATGALQGRVAGVNIEKNVGRPGSGFNVTIRGLSSISNSNSPLFVIDGIPTTSGLADLNPNDIEKIDVLKDASATAIYGSRGANGVVIVTTKKGSEGKFTIQYDAYYGARTPTNLPDMMNGPEYVNWRTDLFNYQGKSTDRSNPEFFTPEEWDRIDRGDYTDWIDLILRNGMQYSNTLTASGGDEKGTFALSIGQLKEEGTVPGQDYNRYNMRLNLNRKFAEKWEAGGNIYLSSSEQNEGSYEILRSSYRLPPVANPYDENGDPKFFAYRNDFVTNPLFESKEDGEIRENRRYRVFGNMYFKVEPLEGLKLRSQIAPQIIYGREGQYFGQFSKAGSGKIENTNANYRTTDFFSYVWDNQIDYQKKMDLHNLNFSVVQSIQFEQWEESYQAARNFPFNSKWYNLDAVPMENISASQTDYRKRTLSSFLGRFQYSYNDKYLFTATGRYDGSSRLAKGNKWAFFPSAAIGWKLSEENFLQSVDQINNLKLRLSYGVSGNDAVDIYGTQSNISQMNYGFGGNVSPSYYKDGLANTDLTWEKTTEFNFGLNYSFFNYRVNGTLDIYRRDAKDLIMRRQLPSTSGWSDIWDNVGWVRNTGVEFGLNTLNIQNNDFSWTTDIVFDRNKNEIVELFGKKEDDIGNRWFIGHPIQVNYDYEFDGIWQTDEADLAADYGQTPGQVKVKDLNNDQVIDADDRNIIGQRTPKWSGSITNTMNYKTWDFSFNVYTRQGQQLYSTFVSTYMAYEGNYKNVDVNYWTEDNPSNKYPQPGNKGRYFNAMRYQDVSFVRLGNVTLGYAFPDELLNKLNVRKLRLYFTATNPIVFTSYKGYDPEWASQNTWGESTSFATYLMGINLEF